MKLLKWKKPIHDIHDNYGLKMQLSLSVVLLLFIIVFRINWQPSQDIPFKEREQEIVELDDIIQTEQIIRPPAPPRPSAPMSVPNDIILEDDIFDLDTDVYIYENFTLTPPLPPPPADEQEDEAEIFVAVEDMPEMIGGMSSVYQHLVYPEIARRAGIEGRVVVQFVIDESGSVHNPVVLRGIGGGADEAAVQALHKVRFTPGRQRGRPVKVLYTITIHFQLEVRSS